MSVRALLALFAMFALLAAACGGGGGGDATGDGGTTATPTPTPTAGVTALQSFRYTLHATAIGVFGGGEGGGATLDINVQSDVAGPEREHMKTTMSLGTGSIELERIEVGDRGWSRSGGTAWVADTGPATGGTVGITLESEALLGREANQRMRATLEGLEGTPERVDNLETLRYTVSREQLRTILGVPPDAPATSVGRIEGDSTLWVTKDEMFPVKLVTETVPNTGGRVQIEVNIRDHNSPAIKVEPPTAG